MRKWKTKIILIIFIYLQYDILYLKPSKLKYFNRLTFTTKLHEATAPFSFPLLTPRVGGVFSLHQ